MIKKFLGIAPQLTSDGAYIPSRRTLKMFTSPKSDFKEQKFPNPYQGSKKIMMVCTEERYLTMLNGKKFSTGNHPVEMLVPMLHLRNAGFAFDIYTPNGHSVKIEEWAFPKEDENVKSIYVQYKWKFENPKNLSLFVQQLMEGNTDYAAVFFPGGHGEIIGLPENANVSKLIHWVAENRLYMLTICHGPAALLSAALDTEKPFPYKDYKMAAFPDSIDKISPKLGYMPGYLPYAFGKRLNDLGLVTINKKADNTVYKDRKLLSGASPKAADNFGKLAATTLLEELNR